MQIGRAAAVRCDWRQASLGKGDEIVKENHSENLSLEPMRGFFLNLKAVR